VDADAILDAETVLVTNSSLAFAIMSKDNVDYQQLWNRSSQMCVYGFSIDAALLM
jgi:hypothetical protein